MALEIADPVRRASTRGRPLLWRLWAQHERDME
jgi:hypothetical protein